MNTQSTQRTAVQSGPNDETISTVFFDGDCSICNRLVRTLLGLDDDERLRFASLQGQTAARLLERLDRNSFPVDSIAFEKSDGSVSYKSDAVIEIAVELGWPYRLAVLGRLVPTRLRDRLYDLVARNRKRLTLANRCRLPSPVESARILP